MTRFKKRALKRIAACLGIIMLFLPCSLHAECDITLNWDPNTPSPDGYRLYQREAGQPYNYSNFNDTGPSNSAEINGLSDNTTYHFVVRAYIGAEESGDSNEAIFTCTPDPGIEPPDPSVNDPSRPYAVSPADNAMDVDLQPTLRASTFNDQDPGDQHAQTRWQIFRLTDNQCIYDTTSSSALTSLTVPSSTLSHFTSYSWTASYYDQTGRTSQPSDSVDFTTLQAATQEEPPVVEEDPPVTEEEDSEQQSALSNSGSSSGSSGGGGSGGGCFIQSLLMRDH